MRCRLFSFSGETMDRFATLIIVGGIGLFLYKILQWSCQKDLDIFQSKEANWTQENLDEQYEIAYQSILRDRDQFVNMSPSEN